jgi:S-adenosylmethionine:tRNA ribosyltransferase-isomerase
MARSPVRTETVEDHVVDVEPYEIGNAAANAIERPGRTGGGLSRRYDDDARSRTRRGAAAALRSGRADATIFIHPKFPLPGRHRPMTNFHLPQSSLLMLVAAFAGRDRVLTAYREAHNDRHRFSYGDAMVIL